MPRGVNKFIGIGTVGKDPETRYQTNGTAVSSLSIAVNESWKDKDGQRQERTEWIRVVFFNRLAEIVNEYVKKGSKLYIEGSLRTRSWEQDGIKRYATEIVASEMQMLDSKSHPQDSEARKQPSADPSPYSGNPGGAFDNFDQDIPFDIFMRGAI